MTRSLTPPVSAIRRASTTTSTPSTTSLIGSTVDGDWTANAACRDLDPDELFVQGAAQNRVKTRCFGCLVRTQCLADALDNHVEFGVWGGMTERERRALLRRRPDVVSWRKLLADAQADHRSASAS